MIKLLAPVCIALLLVSSTDDIGSGYHSRADTLQRDNYSCSKKAPDKTGGCYFGVQVQKLQPDQVYVYTMVYLQQGVPVGSVQESYIATGPTRDLKIEFINTDHLNIAHRPVRTHLPITVYLFTYNRTSGGCTRSVYEFYKVGRGLDGIVGVIIENEHPDPSLCHMPFYLVDF